ncbi:uncharacterized protein P884DRAFT_243641 [Thermothelomyces heterothallicus CBS 202.75]|uniref:uncharacterized protein n=1 Tax=Thermothelomyces heterothallicus CBS 202.75 TaxID=1149848 RepID=UPI00374371C3
MTWSDFSDTTSEDWRKCQVPGCHKKHTGHTQHDERKVYSDFCFRHTCWVTYPEEEGKGYYCSIPKGSDDRYCAFHMKCGEDDCARTGEWPGAHDYARWFCREHRCTYPDCRLRATDRQQQRCAAHLVKCAVPACARPAYQHRDGVLDTMCAAHYGTQRCLWPNCARRASSRYCSAHGCRRPGCDRPRARAVPDTPAIPAAADGNNGANDYPYLYCLAHTCKTPGCRAGARLDDVHCERHARVRERRRPVSLGVDPLGLGFGWEEQEQEQEEEEEEREDRRGGRYEPLTRAAAAAAGDEWQREREWRRLSDDLERIRRRERAREEREKAQRYYARYMAGSSQDRW